MSRGAGEGTRNFVLFDPSIAKIIGRNEKTLDEAVKEAAKKIPSSRIK